MSNVPTALVGSRFAWWSRYLPVLLVGLLSIGCVDQAAIDGRKCQSKGFEPGTVAFDNCREKLEQFKDEEWERRQLRRELRQG